MNEVEHLFTWEVLDFQEFHQDGVIIKNFRQ